MAILPRLLMKRIVRQRFYKNKRDFEIILICCDFAKILLISSLLLFDGIAVQLAPLQENEPPEI
jgi:hypothetical protein